MKEGLKQDVKHVHNLLKHKDRWYLDVSCNTPELYEVCEAAKGDADYELFKMGLNALYNRYLRWRDQLEGTAPPKDSINIFLSDVAFSLAAASLRGEERLMFEDSCSMTIQFI